MQEEDAKPTVITDESGYWDDDHYWSA